MNSSELQAKLTAEKGYVARLADNDHPHAENVTDVFLRVFGRLPRDKERATAVTFLESQANRKTAYASLLWSLVATNEFLFNH